MVIDINKTYRMMIMMMTMMMMMMTTMMMMMMMIDVMWKDTIPKGTEIIKQGDTTAHYFYIVT